MKDIVFLYQQKNELGEFFSLTMPLDMLVKNGITIRTAGMNDVPYIKNSIVYVVKHMSSNLSKILKSNNNLIYLDVVDLLAHIGKNQNKLLNFYSDLSSVDKIVVRQKFMKENLGNYATYIPHHYDYRLNEIENIPPDFNQTKISFPYTDPGGIFFHNEFPELFDVVSMSGTAHLDFEGIREVHKKSMKNNFYFGLRKTNSLEYFYKPGTKTAACSAIGRNIIVNTDKALEDLLPNDYPYYFTKESNEDFLNFYETKIKCVDKNEYEYGLECMKKVKEKTNIYNQLKYYSELFNI